jgi:hypothetical protein
MNGPHVMCISCGSAIDPFDDKYVLGAEPLAALHELVELKRMKDSGATPAEYERRKLQAWRTAFRVCDVVGDPRP